MNRFDARDLIGGLSVVAVGVFSAMHSLRYDIGTINHMGPGYFPFALSVLFTVLGVCIVIPALFRAGSAIEVRYKDLLFVLAATLLFALTIRSLGIFFATVATVVLVSIPGKISLPGSIVLGIVLSILAYLVFVLGLGMAIPAWPWSY